MPRADKPLKKKKCKYCKSFFQPQRPLQYLCPPPNSCSWEYVKKKKQEKIEREDREETKKLKEKLKTLGEYEKDAKRAFQKWVRLRDQKEVCISCGSNTDKVDGGHYLKSELYSGLIFHHDNCHKQCKQCNLHKHGNEINYRIGLVQRIGEDRVRWLEENKDRLRVYKYTKQELIDIKNKYTEQIKQLTKNPNT